MTFNIDYTATLLNTCTGTRHYAMREAWQPSKQPPPRVILHLLGHSALANKEEKPTLLQYADMRVICYTHDNARLTPAGPRKLSRSGK